MKTLEITVIGKDPCARELLVRAIKWLTRLRDRRDELPASFFKDGDPAPLVKEIRKYLSQSDNQ